MLSSFKDEEIHSQEICKPSLHGTSYFNITTSPIRDASGKITAEIDVVRNIDRGKRMEKEREDLIDDLRKAFI